MRSAGPTRARVVVRQEPSRLRVTVIDDGPVPGWESQPGAGQGLRGLRERVEVAGGTLRAEAGLSRLPGGGFSVEAVVPLPSSPPLVAVQSDWAGELGDLPVEGRAVAAGASSSPSSEYADAGSRHG